MFVALAIYGIAVLALRGLLPAPGAVNAQR
jgi:hypothetical protein